MSRVGKKPILIPENVEVKIEGQKVIIKGPKGELTKEIWAEIKVEIKDNQIFVSPKLSTTFRENNLGKPDVKKVVGSKKTKAIWGLTRALLATMVKGVTEGYEKKLEIEGLGFKALVEGDTLVLNVGFSHPLKIEASQDIKFSVEKNVITVSGINKEKVGQVAAIIRKCKPPEPYKGKGIRYQGEVVRRKVGKKVVTAM